MGSRYHLRYAYTDFSEWEQFSDIYGLAKRLGYDSALDAWVANPIVEGSINPSDFRVAPTQPLNDVPHV